MPAPVVPGYDVIGWLGAGATGSVWRGCDRVSGEAVAIKRLYGAVSLAGRDRLRRQAAVLQVLDHPHVVRLHRLVLREDEVVLVLGLAEGGSLATLLARRGRLGAGEVVTIGTPLAQALAAVHARGLVHGAVGTRAVLFSDDGRPLWSDVGLACAIEPSTEPAPTAAGDVFDLGILLAEAVVGSSGDGDERAGGGVLELAAPGALDAVLPRRLASAISAACDPDPAARPSADEFAVMLYDAAMAAPVRLADPAQPVLGSNIERSSDLGPVVDLGPVSHFGAALEPVQEVGPVEVPDVVVVGSPSSLRPLVVPSRRTGRRRRRRTKAWSPRVRRARVVAIAAVTSVLLAVGGWRWWWPPVDAAPAESVPTTAVSTTSGATVPAPTVPGTTVSALGTTAAVTPETTGTIESAADALARLDAKRSLAYATGDAALLRSLYLDASPAEQADLSNLQRMVAAGERTHGFGTEMVSTQVLESSTNVLRLAVIDTVPAFDVRRLDGSLVRAEPGRGQRTFEITLQRVDGRWLYAAVEPVDESA